jgi:glycosyltransferase involved in cell wall biosynthesis
LSLRLADLTLATCEDTRLGLFATATGPVLTAPLGVDADLYQPAVARDDATVLTISHLTRDNVARKRILDVVRVAALLPELRFLIVGRELDGATLVREEISRCGVEDRVELLGHVSASEKRRLLSRASLYFQPTDYEAFGLAIAEAMASGAPVVSNAVGNVPHLIGDTGAVVPKGASVSELAQAVHGLASDPDREGRGQAARRRIKERYSLAQRTAVVQDALKRAVLRNRESGRSRVSY